MALRRPSNTSAKQGPKIYHRCDPLNNEEKQKFSLTHDDFPYRDVQAVSTGEKRIPKKGEWYISGAIPEAYRAYEDLNFEYIIARLVKFKEEVKTTITILQE